MHTLTTRFFDRMRGVDSALQFAVSYHNFVYFFFCRQFMLNPDIIPELVVSGIFINFFWGRVGGVRHHIFFAQFGLHVLQLVALTTAHGLLSRYR